MRFLPEARRPLPAALHLAPRPGHPHAARRRHAPEPADPDELAACRRPSASSRGSTGRCRPPASGPAAVPRSGRAAASATTGVAAGASAVVANASWTGPRASTSDAIGHAARLGIRVAGLGGWRELGEWLLGGDGSGGEGEDQSAQDRERQQAGKLTGHGRSSGASLGWSSQGEGEGRGTSGTVVAPEECMRLQNFAANRTAIHAPLTQPAGTTGCSARARCPNRSVRVGQWRVANRHFVASVNGSDPFGERNGGARFRVWEPSRSARIQSQSKESANPEESRSGNWSSSRWRRHGRLEQATDHPDEALWPIYPPAVHHYRRGANRGCPGLIVPVVCPLAWWPSAWDHTEVRPLSCSAYGDPSYAELCLVSLILGSNSASDDDAGTAPLSTFAEYRRHSFPMAGRTICFGGEPAEARPPACLWA